jgi:hypothetical protein
MIPREICQHPAVGIYIFMRFSKIMGQVAMNSTEQQTCVHETVGMLSNPVTVISKNSPSPASFSLQGSPMIYFEEKRVECLFIYLCTCKI